VAYLHHQVRADGLKPSLGWRVLLPSRVNLIMCPGGECRGVRHDRHFKMYGSTFAENAKLSDVLEHLNET
jgi:hypothetical protein